MKAFGVRFAAGVLTILFGAYAAVLAQKDKQNDPESWSAEAPALGEPAVPIADISADSWISQPDSSDPSGSSPIQLVQHTEQAEQPNATDVPQDSFGIAATPESFPADPVPDPNGMPSNLPVPDWTIPAQDTVAEPGLAATEMPVAEMTLPVDEAEQLPELEINKGPTVDFAATEPQTQLAADLQTPEPLRGGPATATLGDPQNMLRDAPSDDNQLRGTDQFASPAQYAAVEPESYEPIQSPQPFNNVPEPFVPEAQVNQLPAAPVTDPYIPPQTVANSAALATDFPANNQSVDFQQPAGSVAIDPSITVDAPGDRRLEGAQSPSVVIHKRAPTEVKVGQMATFVIHIQNVGSVEALDVKVYDKIPSGMRLIDATPRPSQQGNNLLWLLGAMPTGDERTINLQLVPEQEGELGSVARVSFEAAASVRTISTRPELKIVQTAPETVLIGQQLEIELEVSNPGTGEASNVVMQEDVPEGLEHPKGRQLDNGLGNLAPGEVRRQVLRMRAVAPGIIQNTIRLTGDNGLSSEHTVSIQVIAPELKVELDGPSRRFLERQATYFVHLGNVGTADATNVELSVQLDRGFTFISTENQGQYDPSRHSVHWSLATMPAGGSGKVALTLLPVQEGEQAITLDVRADLGVVAKNERRLSVEGFSELSFSITNPGGPIELGSETSYEIKVSNSGSKSDSNVRVRLLLPPGLELISSEGDAGTDGRGLVEFQPKATLSPGTDQTYKVRVKGVAPGTHIVKAVVVSDLATTPVTKEESTVVYADQ